MIEPRIFVVDDDQDIRISLPRALRMRGFDVEAYESADAFLNAYDGDEPACVILDYGMPGMNGLELQAHMTKRGWPLAVIFVTGHGGVPESVQAIKGGAVDFLEKPFRQTVLLERIEIAQEMARQMYDAAGRDRDINARFERLTVREREIVDRMVESPGEASSKEISRTLGISPRTVDHHRARILEKLQVKSVAELVDLANALSRTK